MADQRAESSASRPPSDSSDAVHAEPGTKPRPEGEIPEIETGDGPATSGSDGGQGDGDAAEPVPAEQVSAADQASVESTGAEPEPADPEPAEAGSSGTEDSGSPEVASTSTDRGESDPAARVDPEPGGAESPEPTAADSEHADSEHADSEHADSEHADSVRTDRPAEASASGAEDGERRAVAVSGPKNDKVHQGGDPQQRTDNIERAKDHQRTEPSDPETRQRQSSHTHPATATFDPMRADTLTMHAVATEAGRAESDDAPEARRRRRIRLTSILAAATFGLAGFLAVTSAVNAKGTDLRAERQTDVADLARAQLRTNRELDARLAELRGEVDELLARQLRSDNAGAAQKKVDELAPAAGLTPLVGPGVTVVLDDAPPSVRSDDTDPDALVVHQQDIQAVVNAMWAGGAEAMMIQGQRVISTSAIRCVGNSVVLHGVPYPPPYRIEAIGDVGSMVQAINGSPAVNTYLEYVADPRYRLGWQLDRSRQLHVPAFEGSLKLDHAEERDVSPGQDSDD